LLGVLQAFGFIGIFIGPVVISLIAILIAMLREELQQSNHATENAATPI
jgi:predicted PurR-regulated permease PerM